MIDVNFLKKICPKTKISILESYVEPLNTVATYYDMFDNDYRIAGFLAQVAHESGGFNFIKENLNYSAEGLRKIFPKYFQTDILAREYARKPEKIANRVYANRMGNGDESSGDGFRFCGRGLIQLTGRTNYTKFSQDLGISLDDTVLYLETVNGAVSSAGWFWDNNKLNDLCDKNDFVMLTKRINGGTIGLEDRKYHYELALQLLKN